MKVHRNTKESSEGKRIVKGKSVSREIEGQKPEERALVKPS